MDDGEIVCIYDGAYADVRFAEAAVCAYSKDWLHWTKKLCIGPDQSPSYASQTQHDTQIWRDGSNGTWYLLSGGCTYNGTNDNTTAGIELRAKLQTENDVLKNEWLIAAKKLDFENTLARDNILNANDIGKMEIGQEYNVALTNLRGSLEEQSRLSTQAFQAAQAVLNRQADKDKQLSDQEFHHHQHMIYY